MGRTITFNDSANRFEQGTATNNLQVTLFMKGGKDIAILDRSDDLAGFNHLLMGTGDDVVQNNAEQGNLIELGAGNDSYVGLGFGSFASDRADTVLGGAGNDLIMVQTFKSLYRGGEGNDRLISVGWQNRFEGGAGVDVISYEARDDDPSLGGVTVDLGAGKAQTGANRFETLLGIENAIGSGSDDALFGNALANRLTGGGGFDQMTGRAGADVFAFRTAAEARSVPDAIDLVTDFSHAQGDRIDLTGIDAKAGVAGNQAFTFIGGNGFTGQKGQLRFADQILYGDMNGDRVADFEIGLLNVPSLVAADILL